MCGGGGGGGRELVCGGSADAHPFLAGRSKSGGRGVLSGVEGPFSVMYVCGVLLGGGAVRFFSAPVDAGTGLAAAASARSLALVSSGWGAHRPG